MDNTGEGRHSHKHSLSGSVSSGNIYALASAAVALQHQSLAAAAGEREDALHAQSQLLQAQFNLTSRCRPIREAEDAEPYLDMLLPAYRQLPERCQLKSRAAFSLGLLASCTRNSELAEGLHLESVLVLDRLPVDDNGVDPLVTPQGIHCLEKLGDALLRSGKYDYGILALERAIDCHWEVSLRQREHDKLIRR
eukprot:8843-Heterococcus_DN1.PRE.1